MLKRLGRLIGAAADSVWPHTEYDPVYGLPKWSVEEWLARNPRIRPEYEAALREWAEAHTQSERRGLEDGGRLLSPSRQH
jgi:hypothetical protein